jgi:sugar lactone lactonase YvrE
MPISPPNFTVVKNWAAVPAFLSFPEIPDVAVDSRDRLHVFSRYPNVISVFEKDGSYAGSWGQGRFAKAHGLYIDAEDNLFVTDVGAHTVQKYTMEGELLMTLGTPFGPSDSGIRFGASPVTRAAGPFNCPTHITIGPDDDIYVTDGYANARVHRFSADGTHKASWGEPGNGPGQFNIPHGLAFDSRGRLYIADRENSRIQVFTGDGELLDIWDFPNRPNKIIIDSEDRLYISEIGYRTNRDLGPNGEPHFHWPHFRLMAEPPPGHDWEARVSVCNTDGQVIATIGDEDGVAPGNILAPHGLALDSRGNLFIGETPVDGGAYEVYAPDRMLTIQKFQRVAP